MPRKEWAAAALVIGFGIVLQIPGHDSLNMRGTDHHGSLGGMDRSAPPDTAAPWQTVTFDVTGMT